MRNTMMKRFFALALIAITLFGVLAPAASAETAAIAATKAKSYFRQNPTDNAKPYVAKYNSIPANAAVEVLGTVGAFYKVVYNGYTGYVKTSELLFASDEAAAMVPDLTPRFENYTITEVQPAAGKTLDAVNFRMFPEKSTLLVSGCVLIKKGKAVTITADAGEFYRIEYDGYVGFAFKNDIKVTGAASSSSNSTSPMTTPNIPANANEELVKRLNNAYAKNNDVVGYIYVAGTRINYPIYNNRYNAKKKDYTYNLSYDYIFSMANPDAPGPICIMGHNMRKSGTMFHDLHHLQNKIMGKGKCEKCGKDVSNVDGSTTLNIIYDGYSQWQIFAMYETAKTEPRATLNYNALNSQSSGAAKQDWINYQIACSQHNFGVNPTSDDKVMILVTCGDLVGGTTGARLYIALKAVA